MEVKLKISAREQKEKTLSHIIKTFKKSKILMAKVAAREEYEEVMEKISDLKTLSKDQRFRLKQALHENYRREVPYELGDQCGWKEEFARLLPIYKKMMLKSLEPYDYFYTEEEIMNFEIGNAKFKILPELGALNWYDVLATKPASYFVKEN